MEKQRNYGIDLLKALAMFGIVSMHITNGGGTWKEASFLTPSSLVLRYFCTFFTCSVNVFAMITGYLYIKKARVKYSGLFNLIFTVVFWCLVITGTAYLLAPQYLKGISLLTCLSPFGSDTFWYFRCYTLLFVFIPFLNKLVTNINQKQFRFLLLALFAMMCIIPSAVQRDLFAAAGGYSSLWLIVCYLTGAYIGLYGETIKSKNTVWILVPIINTLAIVLLFILAIKLFGVPAGYAILVSYISPLNVVNAICLILFFSRLEIKKEFLKKIIVSASKSSFSVYIAHGHQIVFVGVFSGSFAFLTDCNPAVAFGIWLGTAIAIYVAVWILDLLRGLFFKLTKLDSLCLVIGKSIDKLAGFN